MVKHKIKINEDIDYSVSGELLSAIQDVVTELDMLDNINNDKLLYKLGVMSALFNTGNYFIEQGE